MSHVSTVELSITDLDALEAAAKELGLEMVRDKKTYKWYGRWVNDYHGEDAAYHHGISPEEYGKCSHVLRVPDQPSMYEIGLVQLPDGSYKIVFDHWGSGVKLLEKIGVGGSLLRQGYVKHKAVQELQKKGFKLLKQENLAEGGLKLTLKGPIRL